MPISCRIPGWPFEWVSGRGRYKGRPESLRLIHFTGLFVEPDRKALYLTARDRKRRVWSTVVTLRRGALLDAFEDALAARLNAPLRELGEVSFGDEEALAPSPAAPADAGRIRDYASRTSAAMAS